MQCNNKSFQEQGGIEGCPRGQIVRVMMVNEMNYRVRILDVLAPELAELFKEVCFGLDGSISPNGKIFYRDLKVSRG